MGALCWPTADLLYSGSWDGTVREWPVEMGLPSATLAGQAAVLSLDVALGSGLIASAHSDHALRVWDSRLQAAAMHADFNNRLLTFYHSGRGRMLGAAAVASKADACMTSS